MTTDKIFVTVIGFILVGFVYWFFLMKKRSSVSVSGSIEIIVNGGYTPEIISIPLGKKTILNFTRTDDNSCLEEVVLGDFKIKKYLPLKQKVAIEIMPKEKGDFVYSCGMGMFHGKIIVK